MTVQPPARIWISAKLSAMFGVAPDDTHDVEYIRADVSQQAAELLQAGYECWFDDGAVICWGNRGYGILNGAEDFIQATHLAHKQMQWEAGALEQTEGE